VESQIIQFLAKVCVVCPPLKEEAEELLTFILAEVKAKRLRKIAAKEQMQQFLSNLKVDRQD